MPFNFNSLFFSFDINFKIDLEFLNVDIELFCDLGSVVGNIDFVLNINLFDFVCQFNVNFFSINFNTMS